MQRSVNTVEKNVASTPMDVKVVPAGVATDVLPDITKDGMEYVGRYVYNDSGSVAYYAFAKNADNALSYNGKLQDQQQLDCSNHPERVSIYSAAGGKFALTQLRRVDLSQFKNIL